MEREGVLLLPVQFLSQINPVHFLSAHSLKVSFSIIRQSTSSFSKCSPSFKFPHQIPLYTSPLHHTCYVPGSSHCSGFFHPNIMWWEVKIIKFLAMYYFPLPYYLLPLRPKYVSHHPIFIYLHPLSVCHNEGLSYTWIENWKAEESAPNNSKHSLSLF